MNFPQEVVHKMLVPIVHNGIEINEVVLKRPKGKHIQHLPTEPNTKDLMSVASKVSGILPDAFAEFDIADYTAVANIVGNFFMNSQVTGVSS